LLKSEYVKKLICSSLVYKYSVIALLILFALSINSCSSSKGSKLMSDDPESAYLMAKSKYDKRDYLDAIDDFNLIKLRFSGSPIIDKAVYYLGMSYYKREEYILAIYEFESLIKSYPSSKFAEDSKYMLAMCYYGLSPQYNLDQTYTRYAITEFQSFLELFPASSRVSEANTKITELKSKLAFKTLKSAEQYYNLDNYRSALVYYDNVLEEYFDTPYADDALYGKIMVLITKKKFSEANDEVKRFESKFSSSDLLPKVISLKSRIPL